MAHGIHGNGGGGKVSSGSSSSSSGGGKSSSGGGRKYNSPIPKLNYSTTDKSSARGRGNESYLRQDIADQKANGGSINDRNFLAETVESSADQRRSNNEYQKQKEKTRFLDEAVGGREAAEKKAQDKARSDYALKQKQDARQSAADATAEADRLEQEKVGKYGYNPVATSEEEAAAIADTDRQIADLRAKADEELSKVNTTNSKRDAAVDEYLKAVEAERTISDGATILNQAELDAASADRKQKEEALKELNRALGNDEYFGLVDEAQARDVVEGWQGERAAQYGGFIGTGLEWLGNKINNTTISLENGNTGEEQEIWNFRGEGDNLEQLGSDIFKNSRAVNQQAQEDWESGTSTMSGLGKSAAGIGKTVGNAVEDMVANLMLPGSGRILASMRAAGAGALEQDQREGHNDLDSRATKMLLDGGATYLSNWLMGGASAAYDKSVLGKEIAKWANAKGLSPMMQRALNTEGFDEVAELGIGYIGDRVLGLVDKGDSFWSDWSWREAGQEFAVGYFLGFLLNAGAGEQEVDAARAARAADEAVEFGERVAKGEIEPDEAIEIALSNPNESAKMTGKQKAPQTEPEAEVTAEVETVETPQETPTQFNSSMDNGAQSEWHTYVRNNLSGGNVPDSVIERIITSREGRQAFTDVTGISLKGKSEAEVREIIGWASASVPTQTAEAASTPATEEPMRGSQRRSQIDWLSNNPTIANIQELGTITPRQAAQIRNNAGLRAEFERVYEISLDGLGEKAALDAITNAVTSTRANDVAVEAWESERGPIPAAEPSFAEEGPGEPGSKERKEYNRAIKARQDVADILAGTELTRKDATRLMTDEIMWEAFQDATGISLGNKPKTEQNIREAFREAKANMPEAEPEATAEPEAEAEPKAEEEVRGAEPQTEEETEQASETETTAEANANESESEAEPEPEANDTGKQNESRNNASTNANQGQNQQNQQGKQDQKKKTDHTKKTTNPNEETDAEFDKLNEKYGSIEKGENPARDINVPKKDAKGMKVGEGARTIFEADATPEERVASLKAAVVNGNFGHIPVSNDARSKSAVKKLAKDGWSRSVSDFLAAVDSGRADADTIALGAHLLNEAGNSTECSGRQYVQLAMAYNDAVSDAGSRLAAGRILKTLTPEGKLYGMEKTIEKMNKEIRKNNEKKKPGKQKAEIKLNEQLVEDYLNAKTNEERNKIQDKLVKDTAAQVPNTFRDKFTALRYLNMLGNFKTQVRNLAGNTGMTVVQKVKNEARGGIEGLVKAATGGKYEQQYKGGAGLAKRLKVASEDFISDADLKALAMGEKKFSDVAKQSEAEIKDAKKPFSDKNPLGKFLNIYNDLTGMAMEAGDAIFVRANYADALAGYMNAHNISAADWKAMVNDPAKAAEVDKARAFAIKQAQEATFRDTNAVSKFASTFDQRWPNMAKKAAQGVIPFRKTPANVLVRMEEYSPLGVINTAVKGVQAAKGTAEVSEVIDNAAKSLTGTGLTVLGILMASMGKARTKDDDKDEEAFAKLKGQQDYSVEVGGTSMTMDWLSPASAPFFMGVEAYNLAKDGNFKLADLFNAAMTITNPMLEMSMLSGVNDALNNLNDFDGDNSAIAQFVLNSAWSYLTQGISNTMLGQVEQFSEKYRQTYYTDSDNPLLPTWAQKKVAKLGNKTPGADYNAADYIDAWGRKQENDPNLAARAWNTFLNPGYVSKMDQKATEADAVIDALLEFGKTQKERDDFPNVVPRTASRNETVNGTKLTPEEYDVFATTKGQESLKAVTELSKSDIFKGMDEFAQAEAIKDVYEYAEFLAASKIAKATGEEYKDTRFDGLEDVDHPVLVIGTKAGFNDAKNHENWDGIDSLLKAANSGKMSSGDLEYLDGVQGFRDMMYYNKEGVGSKDVHDVKTAAKAKAAAEYRTDANAVDVISALIEGGYSPKVTDAFMGEESNRNEENIQNQVRYEMGKLGKSDGEIQTILRMMQEFDDDEVSKAAIVKEATKNVPKKDQNRIKDVITNWTKDRHDVGKSRNALYEAMRNADDRYTLEDFDRYWPAIDKNGDGQITKKEYNSTKNKIPKEYRGDITKYLYEAMGWK